jgi:hypothetical protein
MKYIFSLFSYTSKKSSTAAVVSLLYRTPVQKKKCSARLINRLCKPNITGGFIKKTASENKSFTSENRFTLVADLAEPPVEISHFH